MTQWTHCEFISLNDIFSLKAELKNVQQFINFSDSYRQLGNLGASKIEAFEKTADHLEPTVKSCGIHRFLIFF